MGNSKSLKGRVLLIDDEPIIREMLEEVFTDLGLEVVCHPDAYSAFPLLSERFDLLICDMMLPRLSGVDFLRKIRSDGLFSGKAILMTGNIELGTDGRVADHVLYKPFQMAEIIHLVRDSLSFSNP